MSLKKLVLKKKHAWAIFGFDGFLYPLSVRMTRRECIVHFESNHDLLWEKYAEGGWSCRKVTIKEGWL